MPTTDSSTQDGLLTVEQLDEGERIRLALLGELDLSNAATVEAKLAEALIAERPVLVDLSRLEFLDSTGISILVLAMQRPDARLLTFVPSKAPGVRRVLQMTGLDDKLPLASMGSADPLLPPA